MPKAHKASSSKEEVYFADDFTKSREFVQSPFRYPGGKYYALKHIIPFLECYPHDEYREPFLGGGSVFFGKRKVRTNWLNDLENNLITTYQIIKDKNKSNSLIKKISNEIASRERHTEVKNMVALDDQEMAFKIYYLNRTSYCGIINKPAWGYAIGQSSPPANWHRFIKGAQPKLENVTLTTMDFSEVLSAPLAGKRMLAYLDPPYYFADQKRAYTKPFKTEDHIRLAAQMRTAQYAFCLSYDDCEPIRDLYSWAYIYERSWFYNTSNTKGTRAKGNELIITNYKVEHNNQFKLV